MTMTFRKAERSAVWLKIGAQGPSGSGKTLGALALARALAAGVGNGRVALVDTENASASLYADRFDFDTLNLEPPYTSARYLEALRLAVEAGYGAVVVDSLSHQWAGDGGILARKEAVDARGGNSFTNWGPFTKEHEAFKAALLALPVHVIATLRTKQDYVMEADSRGKQMPKKVGLAAIQREGMEYELSIMFELQMDHRAATSKDRTGLFAGELVDLTDAATGKRLRAWLASGKPLATTTTAAPAPNAAPASAPVPAPPAPAGESEMTLEQALAFPFPFRKNTTQHGKPLGAPGLFERKDLDSIVEWVLQRRVEHNNPTWQADFLEAVGLVTAHWDAQQTTLPLDEPPPPAAPGEKQVAAPAPGAVAAAIDPAAAPTAKRNGKAAEKQEKQPHSFGHVPGLEDDPLGVGDARPMARTTSMDPALERAR